MQYKNYIFDLYGTLIDIHTDEESILLWEFMTDYLKYHFNTITTASKLKSDYLKLCADETKNLAAKNGSKYPEIKIEWVWKKLISSNCSDNEIKELCTAFREKSRDKLVCYSNVQNVLRQIKEAGSNVYLLSNAQRLFTEKELTDTGLMALFDDIFISSDKGIKKPDPAFIKALIEKHELDTSTTVMVGNEIKADIGSAIAARINGVYLNTYHHTHEEIAQELASIGYDKSNIELTIIDEGDDCFNKMSWL